MLILLPPSEGKSAPDGGDPVDLGSLAYDELLGARREKLLDALERLATLSRGRATTMLGVSKGQAGEVDVDARLRFAPAAPAAEVYTGVLYERLVLPALPAAARQQVLIFSALWGVLRADDEIPYYRLSTKAKLTRIGPLAGFWRPALAAALPDEPGLVVDMRSGAYSAAWKPKQATLLTVRVFSQINGKRKVVTHMAKAVRGDVARALLIAKKPPTDLDGVAAVAEAAGFTVELSAGSLDVITAG